MKIIFTGFLVFYSCSALAQYFQFSQYNFTPQRINPAYVASSDYALLSAVYRNQSTQGGFHLNSTILNVSYPLISSRLGRWSGIGLSFMDDRSGTAGIFNTQEAALSYAINLNLAPFQAISFGAKLLYQRNKIDLSGLSTGAQYVQDRGFDQSLPSGEDLGQFSNHFVTFSTGIHWQKTDKKDIMLAYWDVSFFDFNKPDNAFTDHTSSLNGTFVVAGGMRAFKTGNMSLYPEILYTRSASNFVNAGLLFRCDLMPSTTKAVPHVDFLAKYAFGRSGILGFQYHNDKFAFGLSYDAPVFVRNVANTGTIEVGFTMKRLVRKEVKNKEDNLDDKKSHVPSGRKLGASVGVKKPATTKVQSNADSSKLITRQQMNDRLKQKQDSLAAIARAGAVVHEPLILEKATLYFNFQFNSAALDAGSETYLEDLSKALLDNPGLKIRLEGHTDNVGSEKFNVRLSLERAKAVKTYLISKGVDAVRIEVEGKGMSEPLNSNQNEQEKAKNRRVELEILYDH
ncbi:MAG: PorP/SprF family type IX secretion system membrane protein [Chryseolinea sp.]